MGQRQTWWGGSKLGCRGDECWGRRICERECECEYIEIIVIVVCSNHFCFSCFFCENSVLLTKVNQIQPSLRLNENVVDRSRERHLTLLHRSFYFIYIQLTTTK